MRIRGKKIEVISFSGIYHARLRRRVLKWLRDHPDIRVLAFVRSEVPGDLLHPKRTTMTIRYKERR